MRTTQPSTPRRVRPELLGLALPGVAAGMGASVSTVVPGVSAVLVALVLGAVVANSGVLAPEDAAVHDVRTRQALRIGVALLGLGLPVSRILEVGLAGVVVIALTVASTFAATCWMGRRLRIGAPLVTLIACGFSICGAAAIAAVEGAVRARHRDVVTAVAMVTLFGSLMIALIPIGTAALDLTDVQGAVWAGASVHEVAQVAAAASFLGAGALTVATTVKLGRVLLLAPVYAAAARRHSDAAPRQVVTVPWFLVAFAGAVALRSTGVLPTDAVGFSQQVATFLLGVGMFGLGLGFRVRDLWPVPGRVLGLSAWATTVATGTSLVLVIALW